MPRAVRAVAPRTDEHRWAGAGGTGLEVYVARAAVREIGGVHEHREGAVLAHPGDGLRAGAGRQGKTGEQRGGEQEKEVATKRGGAHE